MPSDAQESGDAPRLSLLVTACSLRLARHRAAGRCQQALGRAGEGQPAVPLIGQVQPAGVGEGVVLASGAGIARPPRRGDQVVLLQFRQRWIEAPALDLAHPGLGQLLGDLVAVRLALLQQTEDAEVQHASSSPLDERSVVALRLSYQRDLTNSFSLTRLSGNQFHYIPYRRRRAPSSLFIVLGLARRAAAGSHGHRRFAAVAGGGSRSRVEAGAPLAMPATTALVGGDVPLRCIDHDPQADSVRERPSGRTGDYAFPLITAGVVLLGVAAAILLGIDPSPLSIVMALLLAGLGVFALAFLGRRVGVDESTLTIQGLRSSIRIPRDNVVAVGFGRVRWKDPRYRRVHFWVDDGEHPVHSIAAPTLETLTPAGADRLARHWAEELGVRYLADATPEGSDPSQP